METVLVDNAPANMNPPPPGYPQHYDRSPSDHTETQKTNSFRYHTDITNGRIIDIL